ncbi:MAG: ABC transporter permease, partial [Lachnospiraceae bacterium]|nr:ABC transporter permease [Lachnospiraceae bacterium]
FIFIILMPLLTMRIMSEERRNKTDQLLLTAPVSVGAIVVGKYLAMLTVFLVPVIVVAFYPLILAQYGEVHMESSYLAVFAYFIVGASFIAVGLFISSITESQIIAAVLSFAALFVSYLSEDIAELVSATPLTSLIGLFVLLAVMCSIYYLLTRNAMAAGIAFGVIGVAMVILFIVKKSIFEGVLITVISSFSLVSSANNLMTMGMLDLTEVVYYVSVIAFFIFITVQSIQKKRWN